MRYILTARAFAGLLCAPRRNETIAEESDDWIYIDERARALHGFGYHVWISRREESNKLDAPKIVTVAEYPSNGRATYDSSGGRNETKGSRSTPPRSRDSLGVDAAIEKAKATREARKTKKRRK